MITGASGGIGRACALALAESGAEVLLHANRRPEVALSAVRVIQKGGGKASFLTADLSVPEKCEAFVEGVLSMHPRVDLLVHAAGVDLMSEPVRGLSFEEKLSRLWNLDVLAAVQLGRNFGETMKKQGRGSLVFFSWDGVQRGMEGDTAQLYGAAKGAVLGFTRSLAQSLAPEVRVNCVSPGWIATTWGEKASEAARNRGAGESLTGRWGTPDEVASAVLFLASDAAAYVNGQNLTLNGGFNTKKTDT